MRRALATAAPRRTWQSGSDRQVARLRLPPEPPIHAPDFAPELVRRPELVDRLRNAPGATLAVIVAPPGYGKSTLLHEWAEADERPFVWIFGGSEPTRQALIEAFDAACTRHRRFVLVVEKADAVAGSDLREFADATLPRTPSGSLVVLETRTEPPVPTGRMRAHRTLVELRTRDLAMSSAEAASLLRKAGVELEFEAVQTLARKTEGWPAALYLAALSVAEAPPGADGSACFAGDDHLVSEFIREEVLPSLLDGLTDFALTTSVLGELTGPLCDHVLRRRGSARELARLARASQLLVPQDAAHSSFRWQGLVREALSAQLRREQPELEHALRLRASAWYQRRGDIDRAIDQAVEAGATGRIGELLWSNLHAYIEHGRQAIVQAWLSQLDWGRIAADPRLAACAAHAALASGRLGAAEHWTRTATAALQCEPRTPERAALIRDVAVIDATSAPHGVLPMRDAAVSAYRHEPPGSLRRPSLCLLAGVGEYLAGDRAAAARLLDRGAQLDGSLAPSSSALCLAQLVMLALERREWDNATELGDRAQRIVTDHGLAACPTSALVFAASAAARAHQGRADEAKRDLRSALELLATLGEFTSWYGAEARILSAYAALWLADIVGARTLLAEASRLARRTTGAVIFERWFDEAWAYMDTVAETTLVGPSSLTIAELRVLRFLPTHRSLREIAAQLGVSVNTVKTQAHAVYRKLGAASRSEAVACASRAGLLGQ